MASMKEVALRAGVSVATVSRVLNNTAFVEPLTRERVETAMRELNYRRNTDALALAKRSGDMLGLLTGNLADPFFSRLAKGAEEITRQQAVKLLVCSGGHQAELEKDSLDFLINQGCEAIVAHLTRMSDADILRYAAHTPALVIINRYIPNIANRCIWLDNASASQAATDYLLSAGHRNIAYITAELPIEDKKTRLDGYLSAMNNAGINVPNDWIIQVPFNEQGGRQAAEKILSRRNHFTAAMTFNDVMAAGMMHALQQQKITLPEQLSIIGFDDIDLASYLYPALTTVHYPVEAMARQAALLALQRHEQKDIGPQNTKWSAQLVIRNSVLPLG